jgi:outer membrane protein assembly factor BamB
VLGARPAAVKAGLGRLLERLVERAGQWLVDRRLQEVEPPPQSPDPREFLAQVAASDPASAGGRPSAFLQALGHLNAAGEERWARAFVELVTPYATGQVPLSFWLMSAVDFWTDTLTVAWDKAEEFPYFSDAERLLVVNFIASCIEYCHDSITYQKWRVTDNDFQVFNHHTFPSKGLYFGCTYMRRHGYEALPLDAWLAKSRPAFERAAQAGRSYDEGGSGYSWLVGNHLMEVEFARGDTTYVSSPRMRHYADLAIAIQNNHFELVPFGDCGDYHSPADSAASVLLRAAEWHRDPGYKWVAEQCAPKVAAADLFTRDLPSAPPQNHVGLFVLPMDPVIHRWAALPHFPNYPPPLRGPNTPLDRSFDKIALRGAWERNADYLLLKGFGAGQHGHPDTNQIAQYQARGRLFITETDYILRMPKQHNMVMIVRDGQCDFVPVTARLEAAVAFPGGALTQSTLVDYNGCDWTRTLLWLSGDCVLVVDSLRAKEAGDYELRCYWRTLGRARLTGQGLHTVQKGEHFHVLELTESERRLDLEGLPVSRNDYPRYRYGDSVPKTLCELRRLRLAPGDEVCFVNLLLPNGKQKALRRSIRWDGAERFAVSGDGPMVRVAPEGIQVGDAWTHAFPEPQRLTSLAAAGKPTLRLGPAMATGTPVAASWGTHLPAAVTALAPVDGGAALAGCADGSILLIGSAGDQRLLAKADGRVDAVLAGRLYGESAMTFMAGARDCKVRLFHDDGSVRHTLDLPVGLDPAWVRAFCLAELDGDGKLWPVVGTGAWRVHPITPDGQLRWTFDTTAHSVTCLAAADLNRDGRQEIAVGTVYYNVLATTADGARLWQDEDYNDFWRAGPVFPFVLAHDVDADGNVEVVSVGSDTLVHCISHLGEKKWTYSIGDEAAGLVLLGGNVCAASLTGDLHCIDGQGRGLWRLGLGSPCTALCPTAEGVAVALENGVVCWVNCAGAVTHRARLPAPAELLASCGPAGVFAAGGDTVTLLRP